MPLGKLQINSLKDLTKVGTVLFKDYREPSLFDLEDLQEPPEEIMRKPEEEERNSEESNEDKHVEIVEDNCDFSDESGSLIDKNNNNSRKISHSENNYEINSKREYDHISKFINLITYIPFKRHT